jgi:hypothetical protein
MLKQIHSEVLPDAHTVASNLTEDTGGLILKY